MSRYLSLYRNCLGLGTRIECAALPLECGNGIWVLICAAGMEASQPTEIKTQGPFHGACEVERVIQDINHSLQAMGYRPSLEMPIWRVHIQAELRRASGRGRHVQNDHQGFPEP